MHESGHLEIVCYLNIVFLLYLAFWRRHLIRRQDHALQFLMMTALFYVCTSLR